MRIGVHLYHLQPQAGGIANFVRTFLREWPALFPDDPLVPLLFPHNQAERDTLPPPARTQALVLQTLHEVRHHLTSFDLLFCPFGVYLPRPLPIPTAVLLMDIQERYHPEYFGARELRDRFYHYTWSLRLADRVIAISDFCKRGFVEKLELPPERIDRIHLCADELPAPARPAAWPDDAPADFLFYPANVWPHKNHRGLFQALRILRGEGLRPACVCTGAATPSRAVLRQEAEAAGVADQVYDLGHLARAEIAWLYRHARLLVLPSFFEGFGIPLVEAMHSGLPIACARAASLPEVAGEAAVYFDPASPEAIAATLREAWSDATLRNRLSQAGKIRGGQFSVEACLEAHRATFARTLADYSPARYRRRRLFWGPFSRMWNLPGAARLALR